MYICSYAQDGSGSGIIGAVGTVVPGTYSSALGLGLSKFLDVISAEEAACLVRVQYWTVICGLLLL